MNETITVRKKNTLNWIWNENMKILNERNVIRSIRKGLKWMREF